MSDSNDSINWSQTAMTAGIAIGAAILSCVGHAAITAYAMDSNSANKPADTNTTTDSTEQATSA